MRHKLSYIIAAAALVSSASVLADTTTTKHQAKHKHSVTKCATTNSRTQALEKDVRSLKEQVAELQEARDKGKAFIGSLSEVYAHGPAVVTSPALGVRRSSEDASDLMVSLPSMNEDLQILRIRKNMDNYAKEHCIEIPQRPILAISGGAEAQVINNRDYSGRNKLDVDLTRAELDFIAEASPWATAAMIISFDNGGINGLPNRVSNSRLYLSRGFLTIGQLNKFPGYLTLGQVYLPFGRYSSYRVTTPSTQVLGRIRQRAGVMGFDYHGLYGQVYAFPGETHVPGSVELGKRGGANLGYKYVNDKFSFDGGAGLTGNMAEAQGMLSNGQKFPNFSGFSANENLKSRVPGVDGYAKIGYKPFTLVAEYLTATKRFDMADMTFNGRGAKPSALDVEGAFDFRIFDKPNTIAIGYGQSWQSLALTVPKRDFFAEYNVSIFKDTIESLEYRHNVNYGAGDVATGNNPIPNPGAVPPVVQQPITVPGKISNSITFQLGIYF